jgi:transcriptional regulator with XRE-family HTH domain
MSDLKKIRLFDKQISQFELSRKSGVHPSRISRLESGSAKPTINELRRISEALGMLPEEVFGLDTMANSLNVNRKKDAK